MRYKRTAFVALGLALLAGAAAFLNNAAEPQETQPAGGYIAEEAPEAPEAPAQPTPAELPETLPPAPEPEPEPEPAARIYGGIDLSPELQEFTFWRCEEAGLDYEMVLALIAKESNYRPDIISATNDYGLMQINQCNHAWLQEQHGITDFLDAEQNIIAGTEILAALAAKYDDPHQILMAYNMGEGGARTQWERGNMTSAYSRDVMARRAEILEKEEDQC